MGEILTQTIIESEEAHFKQNPVPRLKLIRTQEKCVELPKFEKWVIEYVDQLLYQKARFENNGLFFEPRFGYVAVKCMLENLAEFSLHRRHHDRRLKAHEVYQLKNTIRRNELMKTYWNGATLGMLLEKDDALSDRELYNLLNPNSGNEENLEKIDSFPLNSYPEIKIKKIFTEIDEYFEKSLNDRTVLKNSIGLVSTLILLPIFIFSRM
tara:strand:- start:2357 stop:2986 length:630 start_codon:yes stop_codon:yes gene_type:complete